MVLTWHGSPAPLRLRPPIILEVHFPTYYYIDSSMSPGRQREQTSIKESRVILNLLKRSSICKFFVPQVIHKYLVCWHYTLFYRPKEEMEEKWLPFRKKSNYIHLEISCLKMYLLAIYFAQKHLLIVKKYKKTLRKKTVFFWQDKSF